MEFLRISGNWIWGNFKYPEVQIKSKKFSIPWKEGFKTRSNFRGLKLWLNKRYTIQNLSSDIHTCIGLWLKDHEIYNSNYVLVNLNINMDFLMKQQSIMLNANCQLIQCTHIIDLLSNFKRLLDSMILKSFYCDTKCLMFTDVPKSSKIHQLFLGTQLPHV